MQIELKIRLKIPNKIKDVNSIEEFVFRERNKIGKMIFIEILKRIEQKRLNNLKKATKSKHLKRCKVRYLLYRYKEKEQ
jgi:hypothetical protein